MPFVQSQSKITNSKQNISKIKRFSTCRGIEHRANSLIIHLTFINFSKCQIQRDRRKKCLWILFENEIFRIRIRVYVIPTGLIRNCIEIYTVHTVVRMICFHFPRQWLCRECRLSDWSFFLIRLMRAYLYYTIL